MSRDLAMWLLEQAADDTDRRIIEHCRDSITGWQEDESNSTDAACAIVDLEHVLKLLALPYADRPGYREEWRP